MENLKQTLAQQDTILFIGSGVSLWANLPTWSGMIEELAKYSEKNGGNAELIRAEAKRGDLLQAASYGFDTLTKPQIGDFIRAACRYGVAEPHEIHRKIVSLGPRCFITTNYDNLIEKSLQKWQPNRFYRPPVTNRHLTETAEIVHARAIDFIFKPHGDASDCESIILTREQYRQLLPQGERHAALESLKTLLVSRPVVYIGFGLKDPDFIYLRDLLANTYKGGTRDHYALMADVSVPEVDYWRRNYGIHLTSYETSALADGRRDHSAILGALDNLLPSPPTVAASTDFNPKAPEVLLALARYGSALGRATQVNPELPIRVTAESRLTRRHYWPFDKFDHCPVEKFLDSGPDRAVLIGLPGAGKTYALRRSAARLAEKLREISLSDSFDESKVIVPIIIDLKLYKGDFAALVNQTLPMSLQLHEVIKHFKSKIFLDSFNEMPREYWESGSYEADLTNFVTTIGHASLIIGSRTTDGLTKLELPAYNLDQIDEAVVTQELEKRGIKISGRFGLEISRLLQKPFYFQFIANGALSLPKEAHPKDLYQSLFYNLQQAYENRFGNTFNIENALSITAYDAIDRGQEAFPLSEIIRPIKTNLEAAGLSGIDARDVVNWLVSQSILIPYTGARISFVHQSVTEFLAAKELARRYQESPKMLREKLTLTRWDQALFLTLSFLPESESEVFFNTVISVDFTLAMNAVKYLEVERDRIVSKLLSEIPVRRSKFDQLSHQIAWALQSNLPISDVHEPDLRALMKLGGTIGSSAVIRLVEMKGLAVKNELLQAMVESRSDYNYCCNGIASALQGLATRNDIQTIRTLAETLIDEVTPDSDENTAHGFTSAVANFLSELELSDIRDVFLPIEESGPVPEIFARILCQILQCHHSTYALQLAGDMLLRGVGKAATAIYFISHFSKSEQKPSWTSFNLNHLDRLMSMIDGPADKHWPVEALHCLCAGRPDLAEVVRRRTSGKSGIEKAVLLYCVNSTASEPILDALCELATLSKQQRNEQPTHLLKHIGINWIGQEALFVRLLMLRDREIALGILDGRPDQIHSWTKKLEIGPIDWWLDWLIDEKDFFLQDRISRLFASSLDQKVINSFVAEFNKINSKYRPVLARSILLARSDLSTDEFSADAVSYLLADLRRSKVYNYLEGSLLGLTTTDRFVVERLLPLTSETDPQLVENLQQVLQQAGKRHGRRYIPE